MRYRIEHLSQHRLRIRVQNGALTEYSREILDYALNGIPGVRKVIFYPATGGIGIAFDGPAEEVTRRLDRLRFDNVTMMAGQIEADPSIDMEELRQRRLSPELKSRLRRRILLESAADMLLPMPVQMGYHLYQLITLREI